MLAAVEARAANRAVTQGMLDDLGYTVETVESGEEALVRHAEPDGRCLRNVSFRPPGRGQAPPLHRDTLSERY